MFSRYIPALRSNHSSEIIDWIKLKLEHRYRILDFKYDLSIIKHSELQGTLGIGRTDLFEDIRANGVIKLYFWIYLILFIVTYLRRGVFNLFNRTTAWNISFNGY